MTRFGKALAGAHEDGHARPTPVVDLELHGHVGLGAAVGRHAVLLPVADHLLALGPPGVVLGPDHVGQDLLGRRNLDRPQGLDLLVADALGVDGRRWLHQGERQHLQDVVLDDVPQSPCRFVEPAPMLDSEGFGHGDLHVIDVASVPHRFEDGVGEAQGEQVLDGLLPEVVVDAVDLVFLEDPVQGGIQLVGAGQVPSERLLDHQPDRGLRRIGVIEAGLAEGIDDLLEDARDGGQVEGPVAHGAPLLVQLVEDRPQSVEGVGMGVVARDVAEAS